MIPRDLADNRDASRDVFIKKGAKTTMNKATKQDFKEKLKQNIKNKVKNKAKSIKQKLKGAKK